MLIIIFHYYNFFITAPNISSSIGNILATFSGLDIHATLIKSSHVMLLLVPLPPHDPQPNEKVWRIPFHKLPLLWLVNHDSGGFGIHAKLQNMVIVNGFT
jgi:hypothetical protein